MMLFSPARMPGRAQPSRQQRGCDRWVARNLVGVVCFAVCAVWSTMRQAWAQESATWDGSAGLWSDESKWDTALFPHNGNGGLTYDATVNGGTVTLDQDLTIQRLVFAGGTIDGPFELTANTGATFNIPTPPPDPPLTLNAARLTLDGTSTISQTNNRFAIGQGTVVQIVSTGTLDLQSDATIGSAGPEPNGGTFDNRGIVTKTAGSINRVNMPFNNSGTVEARTGIIRLSSGGSHTGDFQTVGAGSIQFGLNHVFLPASVVRGNTNFVAGTIDINGIYDLDSGHSSTFTNGRANFNSGATVGNVGDLIINGGVANLSSGQPITATSHRFTSRAGALTGSDTITVTGRTTFLRGEIRGSGVTDANGGMDIGNTLPSDNSNLSLRERTVNISGSSTWFGTGNLTVGNGGTLVNLGALDIQNDITVLADTDISGGTLRNMGTITKSAGNGTTSVAIALDNAGTVEVQTPSVLSLSGGGIHSGVYNAPSGATIQFSGGTHELNAGATFNGTWSKQLSGGTLNINDPATLAAIEQAAGTFEFTSGALNITNGDVTIDSQGLLGASAQIGPNMDLGVSGTTKIGTNGTVRLSGGTLTTATLDNTAGGTIHFDAGTLTITGTGTNFGADPVFLGEGDSAIFNIETGANVLVADLVVGATSAVNLSGGRLDASTIHHTAGGTFNFSSGAFVVVDFDGDLVQDGGTLVVGPSVGITTVSGNYTMNAGSVQIGLAGRGGVAGTDFDQVNVVGEVALTDTLDVTVTGDSAPQLGDVFPVITAGTRVGEFEDINGVFVTDDMTLAPLYDWRGTPGVTLVAAVPGDSTLDGIVNGADLTVLGANWDLPNRQWLTSDFNLDGKVNGADLMIMGANWTAASGMSFAMAVDRLGLPPLVPAPETLAMWGMGSIGVLWRRRTR